MRTATWARKASVLVFAAGMCMQAGASAAGTPGGGAPPVAKDGSSKACIEAYERVQTLREQGALGDARAAAIACSADACPKVLAKECATWLDQLTLSQPTVVLGATAPDGKDLTRVRVTVDGKPLATELGARALPVDPGAHKLRFESDEHGAIDLDVVVREGEKNRRIVAAFTAKATVAPSPGPSSSVASNSDEGLPVGFWVLGGVGLAGVAAGATFEVLGLLQASELDACKPRCAREDADAMATKFVVGDVSIGAGVAALVGAVVVALTDSDDEPQPSPEAARVHLVPALGPGFLGVVGTF
jgi:hypothetical protein